MELAIEELTEVLEGKIPGELEGEQTVEIEGQTIGLYQNLTGIPRKCIVMFKLYLKLNLILVKKNNPVLNLPLQSTVMLNKYSFRYSAFLQF